MMRVRTLGIINKSSAVSDADVEKTTKAIQIQVTRDFEPIYKTGPTKVMFNPTDDVDAVIYVMDNDPSVDNALGYHTLNSRGVPWGVINAELDIQQGTPWSTTLSHEVLELLADPEVDRTERDPTKNIEYSYEVCDAVEDDRYAYKINGVAVSDFVFPEWFSGKPSPTSHYDFMRRVDHPGELLPGGYITENSWRGWHDVFAELGVRNSRRYGAPTGTSPNSRHDRKAAILAELEPNDDPAV